MKTIRFYDKLYMVTYYVYIGGTAEEFIRRLALHKVKFGKNKPRDYAYFKGIETKDSYFGFIWAKTADHSIVAHECLHAVAWTFDKVGIPINKKTDEAACYYQQYLMTEIFDRIK